MDLDTFIVAIYCLIDEVLGGERLRERGPRPALDDREVLTIEDHGVREGFVSSFMHCHDM